MHSKLRDSILRWMMITLRNKYDDNNMRYIRQLLLWPPLRFGGFGIICVRAGRIVPLTRSRTQEKGASLNCLSAPIENFSSKNKNKGETREGRRLDPQVFYLGH